jgi:hypothetical protein
MAAASCGAAFALAASIKPTLMVGMPALLAWLWLRRREAAWSAIAWVTIGFAATVVSIAGALWSIGVLPAFLDVAWNYWPLYAEIDDGIAGTATITDAARRAWVILASAQVQWLAPATLAGWIAWRSGDHAVKDQVALLALMSLAYLAYSVLGHGRVHEWIPFFYFTIVLATVSLGRMPGNAVSLARAVAFLALLFVAGRLVWLPERFVRQVTLGHPHSVAMQMQLALAERARLHGGDHVRGQLLEWMDGGATAMLVAGVEPATAFFYDLPFHHHTSTPYVRALRDRFIRELTADPPDIIVRRSARPPIVSGPDNARPFHRLEAMLLDYELCYEAADLELYHRRGVPWRHDRPSAD